MAIIGIIKWIFREKVRCLSRKIACKYCSSTIANLHTHLDSMFIFVGFKTKITKFSATKKCNKAGCGAEVNTFLIFFYYFSVFTSLSFMVLFSSQLIFESGILFNQFINLKKFSEEMGFLS